MKKLFLLVGLIVFLTPMMVSANENKTKQQQYIDKLIQSSEITLEEEHAILGLPRIEQQERTLGRKLDSCEKSCLLYHSYYFNPGDFTYKLSECLPESLWDFYISHHTTECRSEARLKEEKRIRQHNQVKAAAFSQNDQGGAWDAESRQSQQQGSQQGQEKKAKRKPPSCPTCKGWGRTPRWLIKYGGWE